jgi:hypothetical protein
MVLLADPSIEDYYAIQERPGHLRIHLTIKPEASFAQVAAAVTSTAQDTLAEYNCQPADLQIAEGLPILPIGTKRRRVVRKTPGIQPQS